MRRLFPVVFVLLAIAGGAAVFRRRGAAPDPEGAERGRAVPVLVAPSRRQDVAVWLNAIGTVQAYNTVALRTVVDGPLVEVRFHEGADVKAGEVLARIDPRPLQAALDQYVGKKAQDEAQLANARLDLERYRKLTPNAYTSAQTTDTQRATVAANEALVRQDQAQIDAARAQLGYATIAAPFDGRAGFRQVDVGNIVHPGDATPLTVITQLRPIFVVFALPQQNLADIVAAMRAGPTVVQAMAGMAPGDAGLSADGPREIGRLAVLDNQVDAATGTIRLKAVFANDALALWPGGFANLRVLGKTLPGVVTIPPEAVQRGPKGDFVYLAAPDRTAVRRPVTLGYQDERVAVVTDGLGANEPVVTDGAARLSDGARLRLPGDAGPEPGGKDGKDGKSGRDGRAGGAHRRRDAS